MDLDKIWNRDRLWSEIQLCSVAWDGEGKIATAGYTAGRSQSKNIPNYLHTLGKHCISFIRRNKQI